MCELMFPKPTRKKKRKHHPAPIVDTVKGECFLCRLEGIRRQQYTEEHHVFYGGGLRQVIAGQVYQVYDTLETHEYIVIDSRKKTIIKRLANGTEQNIFYKKATGNSIFTEIPPGDILINWSGEFGFDIVVYKERSVPEWISSKQINTEGR